MTYPPDDTPSEKPIDPLTEQALGWLVRLHSGDTTETDWSDYHDWKAKGADHRAAAERAERLWLRLGPALKPTSGGPKRLASILLLVGGLGAAGFVGGAFGPPRAYFADERSGVGERRTAVLADGSRVELDADTSFDVAFDDGERRLTLYEGRIHVAVAADPARAFVVEARGGATRALGTAFDVQALTTGAAVLVTEHAVRVSYPASGAELDLREGEAVSYSSETGLGRPEAANVRDATAWRRGLMILNDRRLSDAIADMAPYVRGRIVVVDSEAASLSVTGVFPTGDADAMLDALAAALPLRVTRLPLLTLIRSDPARMAGPGGRDR